MILMRRAERLRACVVTCRNYATVPALKTQTDNDEYTEQPEYPKIKDLSFKSRKKDERLTWHEEIQKVKTVEEKMIKINMPRYYGYKVVQMNEASLPYNCLPAIQHYTRTLFENLETKSEQEADAKLVSNYDEIKAEVQSNVEMCHRIFK